MYDTFVKFKYIYSCRKIHTSKGCSNHLTVEHHFKKRQKENCARTLRAGDGSAQPGELPENDEIWSVNPKVKAYGQHLAQQVSVGFSIDPAEGVEPVIHLSLAEFPGKIVVQESKTAKDEAQKDRSDLALWLEGSKLESGGSCAAAVWKNPASQRWDVCKISLGKIRRY